jgi:hypothetical protein
MGRLVLALLVVVMLSLTSYVAYTQLGSSDCSATCPAAAAVNTGCPHETPSCCTETAATAATDDAPACCKEKANCCQTKGEDGACCQNPSKAQAIAGAKKPEAPKTEPKTEPKND